MVRFYDGYKHVYFCEHDECVISMTYSSQLCCPPGFALVLVVLLSHPGPLGACIADAATPLSSLIWCWLVLLVLAS